MTYWMIVLVVLLILAAIGTGPLAVLLAFLLSILLYVAIKESR